LVAQLLDLDAKSLTTQDLGQAANLSGLAFEELPGLAELFQLEGPAHRMEYHVRRRECLASTVQALLLGGRGEPVALLLDDVDNYDAPSREILRRLANSRSTTPLTLLVTSEESDLDWLQGEVERLGPLSENAVRQLCRQVTIGVSPQSSLPAILTKAAPLTPLRLELQLRVLALGLEAPSDATDADLVTLRVEHLDDAARRVLEVGAMLGERFPESDLGDLLADEPDLPTGRELDEILAQLHTSGLLLITGRGERAFYHQKLHELVYGNIQESRRRTLHRRVATSSLVAQSSANIEARHWLGAGARDAVEVLEKAADAAVRSFDDSNASMQLRAALRMCEQLAGDSEGLAWQARLAGKANEVMRHGEAAQTAMEILEGQLKKAHGPQEQSALREALGRQLARQGRYDEAMSMLQKALAPVIAAGDRAAILRIYDELGNVHMRQGNDRRALAELREGLDMCTMGEGPRSDVDLDMWRYLLRMCDAMRSTGDISGARAFCEHALHQAERRQDALGRLRCHAQMAFVLREAKQVTLGEKHLCRALDEARYFGDRLTTAELLLERARARASHGKIDDARRSCEEALRLAKAVDWKAGIEHAERALSLFDQEKTE
jgi:serine/threonine-protein kinase